VAQETRENSGITVARLVRISAMTADLALRSHRVP
jgi:hypothetical protein